MPKLELIKEPLAIGYEMLEKDSFMTSVEWLTERRINPELRAKRGYTSNFVVYDIEDGSNILYFGGRDSNPILSNIYLACNRLIKTGNYLIGNDSKDEILGFVESGKVLRINLSDNFNLEEDEKGFFFKFNRDTYNNLPQSKLRLAEALFSKDSFYENYCEFNRTDLETKIYLPDSDYIKENAKDGAFARSCWFESTNLVSFFDFVDANVFYSGWLCGQLKEQSYDVVYETLVEKLRVAYEVASSGEDISRSDIVSVIGSLDDYLLKR